jgi:hypothetical protein
LQDIIARAKRIKEMEEGITAQPVIQDDKKDPIVFRIFDSKLSVVVCLALIPVVLISTFSMGSLTFYPPEEDDDGDITFDPEDYDIIPQDLLSESGTLNVDQSVTFTETINSGPGEFLEEGVLLRSITFELTWEDGVYQPAALVWDNGPDEFRLTVSEGTNYTGEDSAMNPQNGQGMITFSFEFDHETIRSENGLGEWVIEVTLVASGDYQHPFLPLTNPDGTNDYTLVGRTELYVPK